MCDLFETMLMSKIFYYSILFIYYLLDYHICAFIICARQNKESEKGLLNTNKQKTNTRTYVNQRDDMLTKTRNQTTTEYTLMHNKYIITYECHDNAPRMWKVVQLIREIFWLLPVLSPLLPVVSHFSFVSTWKRSHFSLWFQSSGSPDKCASLKCLVCFVETQS